MNEMNNLRGFFFFYFVFTFSFILISCSQSDQESTSKESSYKTEDSLGKSSESVPTTLASNEPEGLQLMKTSDCFTCHRQDEKVVGPSFKMIKEKYLLKESNINDLSNQVIKGSVGVWGQIAMPGHLNLEKDDAKKMIRYILSL